MNITRRHLLLLYAYILCVAGCGPEERGAPLFKLLAQDHTGITFANTITTSDSANVQFDSFVYNGGGVAIGDIDNDGLAIRGHYGIGRCGDRRLGLRGQHGGH
jgi:hypothetical protein